MTLRPTATKLLVTLSLLAMTPWEGMSSARAADTKRGFTLNTNPARDVQDMVNDVDDLANQGATIVRFQCYFTLRNDLNYWYQVTDRLLEATTRRNLTLSVAFSMPSDYFQNPKNDQPFAEVWGKFAKRYAKQPGHLWYELCNEPRSSRWPDVALKAAVEIRKQDTRHAIAYPARDTTTATAPSITMLPKIDNQILVFHFYDWPYIQFDNYDSLVADPAHYNPMAPFEGLLYTNASKALLKQRLTRVAEAGSRNNVPVFISEVAIAQYSPSAATFLADFTSTCDNLGINLTVHSYNEAPVWNYAQNPAAWTVLTHWLNPAKR